MPRANATRHRHGRPCSHCSSIEPSSPAPSRIWAFWSPSPWRSIVTEWLVGDSRPPPRRLALCGRGIALPASGPGAAAQGIWGRSPSRKASAPPRSPPERLLHGVGFFLMLGGSVCSTASPGFSRARSSGVCSSAVGLLFCQLAWNLTIHPPAAFTDHTLPVWWLAGGAMARGLGSACSCSATS